jgi:hypothetical protein
MKAVSSPIEIAEPGKHTPLSALPSGPGFLDLIKEWLMEISPEEK